MDEKKRKICCHCNQIVSKSNFYLKHRDGKCLKKVITVKLLTSKDESSHSHRVAGPPSNDQTDLQQTIKDNSEAIHPPVEKGNNRI